MLSSSRLGVLAFARFSLPNFGASENPLLPSSGIRSIESTQGQHSNFTEDYILVNPLPHLFWPHFVSLHRTHSAAAALDPLRRPLIQPLRRPDPLRHPDPLRRPLIQPLRPPDPLRRNTDGDEGAVTCDVHPTRDGEVGRRPLHRATQRRCLNGPQKCSAP